MEALLDGDALREVSRFVNRPVEPVCHVVAHKLELDVRQHRRRSSGGLRNLECLVGVAFHVRDAVGDGDDGGVPGLDFFHVADGLARLLAVSCHDGEDGRVLGDQRDQTVLESACRRFLSVLGKTECIVATPTGKRVLKPQSQ